MESIPMSLARAKPKLLAIHRWLALVAGLFVLSQGISGTLIAFRYELNRVLHPGAMTVTPMPVQPVLSHIIDVAQKALPGAKAMRIDYPRAPDDAYIVRLSSRAEGGAIATVDQAGRVTRAGSLWRWPVEAAYAMHESLMAGETGQRAVGFIGLAVLVLAISGLFYWWPAARFARILANTVKPGLVKGRIWRELHRGVGVLYALYLILLAAIGMTMAWSPWTQPLIGALLPFSVQRPAHPGPCTKPVSIDTAVASAVAARPMQAIKSVRIQAKGRVAAVYFQSRVTYPPRSTDHVWVSACDAAVLSVDDKADGGAGNGVFDWLLPIHTGEWLGLFGRLLSWSAALAVTLMGISGYVLWVLRLKKKKRG